MDHLNSQRMVEFFYIGSQVNISQEIGRRTISSKSFNFGLFKHAKKISHSNYNNKQSGFTRLFLKTDEKTKKFFNTYFGEKTGKSRSCTKLERHIKEPNRLIKLAIDVHYGDKY